MLWRDGAESTREPLAGRVIEAREQGPEVSFIMLTREVRVVLVGRCLEEHQELWPKTWEGKRLAIDALL